MLQRLYPRIRQVFRRMTDHRRPVAGMRLMVPWCRGDIVVLLRERMGE